jgi:hypothetical protein
MSQLKVDTITDEAGTGSPSLPNGLTVGGVNYPSTGPLSNRNKIINGAMVIDQRNAGASFSVGASGSREYCVDRFGGARPGSGVAFNLQQVANAPTGFITSLQATVPTGAVPSGTQLSFVGHAVEGANMADLAWGSGGAKDITLSFWVKSSVTGLFPLVLSNNGHVRAYGATYTISAADTWEYKTVTIPGDTSGTWLTTSGIGVQIAWGLGGAGAARTVSLGWQNTSSPGSSVGVIAGTVNLVETTGATWQITGVQLEAGTVATPFEHRSFGQELALCMRYYQTAGLGFIGYWIATSAIVAPLEFDIRMRAAPTASVLKTDMNISDGTAGRIGSPASISNTATNAGNGAQLTVGGFTGATQFRPASSNDGANLFGFSAEL